MALEIWSNYNSLLHHPNNGNGRGVNFLNGLSIEAKGYFSSFNKVLDQTDSLNHKKAES